MNDSVLLWHAFIPEGSSIGGSVTLGEKREQATKIFVMSREKEVTDHKLSVSNTSWANETSYRERIGLLKHPERS